jgi:cysteinyl-tRNA synthetase
MTEIQIYNTLTRRKERLEPREPGVVSMYVCGVTPYSSCHLGHARCYVTYDVIRRYLEHVGYRVRHVQNFTDVDDKIIARAQQEGRDPGALANGMIEDYFRDMDDLGIQRADFYPRVTDHIPDILELVQGLVEQGAAYVVEGDVYLEVDRVRDYGKLSRRNLEELQAGARVEVDERKRSPLDFALWKAAKPGEPAWDSPWGPGRPGWHIECSAMSLKYLGSHFDLHGGGQDLIFPHHENEIAQSEAYTGQPFVRCWIHNGLVNVRGEKMAKSLGNFFTVRGALERYDADTIRLYFLTTHYRSPLTFEVEEKDGQVKLPPLDEASQAMERLRTARHNVDRLLRRPPTEGEVGPAVLALAEKQAETVARFHAAMHDDFNSAAALGAVFELVGDLNRAISADGFRNTAADQEVLRAVQNTIQELCRILGLFQGREAPAEAGLVGELMQLLIDLRQEARARKDWPTADAIRTRLNALGIALEDHPDGTTWRRVRREG